ncbi:hypothetical protein CRUP_025597 [Coryphaenoides rupestris]|nr:hypothetical protein CRUP_025597 [Coryphaenoides rupestris]
MNAPARLLPRAPPPLLLPLLLLLLAAVASLLDAELVCWQAVLRCHDERECELAYRQYLAACDGNLRGTRSQCPSHCIGALIRLNHTRGGPGLETCDCARDAEYTAGGGGGGDPGIGCTEARQRCEEDGGCHASLAAYLSYCGQLFNGRKCSSRCKATIQQMLFIPSGVLLNRCVCDGVERPFCEVVKENMSKLCAIGGGDGGAHPEQPEVDDLYEDELYDPKNDRDEDEDVHSGSWRPPPGFLSSGVRGEEPAAPGAPRAASNGRVAAAHTLTRKTIVRSPLSELLSSTRAEDRQEMKAESQTVHRVPPPVVVVVLVVLVVGGGAGGGIPADSCWPADPGLSEGKRLCCCATEPGPLIPENSAGGGGEEEEGIPETRRPGDPESQRASLKATSGPLPQCQQQLPQTPLVEVQHILIVRPTLLLEQNS